MLGDSVKSIPCSFEGVIACLPHSPVMLGDSRQTCCWSPPEDPNACLSHSLVWLTGGSPKVIRGRREQDSPL